MFRSGSGRSLIVFALASSLTVMTSALARNSRDSSLGGRSDLIGRGVRGRVRGRVIRMEGGRVEMREGKREVGYEGERGWEKK